MHNQPNRCIFEHLATLKACGDNFDNYREIVQIEDAAIIFTHQIACQHQAGLQKQSSSIHGGDSPLVQLHNNPEAYFREHD